MWCRYIYQLYKQFINHINSEEDETSKMGNCDLSEIHTLTLKPSAPVLVCVHFRQITRVSVMYFYNGSAY